ncbi:MULTISPECIES: N-formylglutamate amidohydrolase [Leisingera]|jgi:N-formylglutamate deformylase|uniref:N-formylglutamate amidohydrolase n=1 Tax=Leisingera TaxID=191028 RepID=UPI0011534BCB|nr:MULTISPECIES: N-formylglutamate amidohydrolase [Leisingera]QDI77359.1 N-formylglutamate amidohydrolase [Leisingera aquaemixtae]
MPDTAFFVISPQKLASAVVFASPHSGTDYSDSFLAQSILGRKTIRSSEDAFVDQLFQAAPEFGAPLLTAVKPRAFLDLNRSPDELDPAVIDGVQRRGQNPRVASGLGVIPRVVANGRAIYRGKLTLAEAEQRISCYWHPYHQALKGLLEQAHRRFGQAILVDCHSMPHEAIDTMAPTGTGKPEVVLGDRFGAAADSSVVDRIEAAFSAAGLKVARNTPFAGAYIAQTYGRPSRRQHAVQIEIDRALYMDEANILPNANFAPLQKLLRQVTAEIAAIGQKEMPLAAE